MCVEASAATSSLACESACRVAYVPKTLQIRDVDDRTYAELSIRAAQAGLSVPEFVRRELDRIASRPSVAQWLSGIDPTVIHSEVDAVASLEAVRGTLD